MIRTPDPQQEWTEIGPDRLDLRAALREIPLYRELFVALVRRNIYVRFKQTFLGIAWAVLQPVIPALIFSVIFGYFIRLASHSAPYLPFVFCGLVVWSLFAGTIQSLSGSLVREQNLFTKVYFPRLYIPLATSAVELVNLVCTLAVLLTIVHLYGYWPGVKLMLLPLVFLPVITSALGIGFLTAALDALYRDVGYIVPFTLQTWMYASPIIYPTSAIPTDWQWLFAVNPLVGTIEGLRWIMLDTGSFPLGSFAYALVFGLAVLALGTLLFLKMESRITDLI